MRRIHRLLGVVAVTAVLAGTVSAAYAAALAPKRTTLVANNMTGAQVVPGPGDPDGFGTARLPNDAAAGRICWNVNTERLTLPITGALIHAGSSGQQGTVALNLFGEQNTPDPSGCKTASTTQLRDLNQKSQEYYLEIGSEDLPEGAIRGQLRHESFEESS